MSSKEFVMETAVAALDLIGLHPFKKSALGRARAFLYSTAFLGMYLLNVAGAVSQYDGIKSLEESVDSIPAGQQVLVKVFAVILTRKRFEALFAKMDRMWPNDIYGPDLESKIERYQIYFKRGFLVFKASIFITATAYASKPLLTFSRIFATAWYIPCDYHYNVCYISIVVAQNVYIIMVAFAIVVFDFIFFSFLFTIYCELEKIKFAFKNLQIMEDTKLDDAAIIKEFSNIVKQHNFLLKFTKDLDNVYSLQLLNHISTISATIVFGVFFMNMDGFPPSGEKLYRYIPYLITYTFQLYIYCLIGDQISEQIESVGDDLYESKWYNSFQPKLSKGIIMVLNISKTQGNKLTIGGIWKLDLRIFMLVLKTSVSFHAFMQTIYQQN